MPRGRQLNGGSEGTHELPRRFPRRQTASDRQRCSQPDAPPDRPAVSNMAIGRARSGIGCAFGHTALRAEPRGLVKIHEASS